MVRWSKTVGRWQVLGVGDCQSTVIVKLGDWLVEIGGLVGNASLMMVIPNPRERRLVSVNIPSHYHRVVSRRREFEFLAIFGI